MRLQELNQSECTGNQLHNGCRGLDSNLREAGEDRQNGSYDEDLMAITIVQCSNERAVCFCLRCSGKELKDEISKQSV